MENFRGGKSQGAPPPLCIKPCHVHMYWQVIWNHGHWAKYQWFFIPVFQHSAQNIHSATKDFADQQRAEREEFIQVENRHWNHHGIQTCTIPYYTILYQYCTILYQYCTILYCTCIIYCTVLYCTVTILCTVLYCTTQYTVLYCTAMYCTVPTYTVPQMR